MATEYDVETFTLPAGADLSAKQFYFVELNNTGKVTVCNSAGERAFGVLQNDPTANQAATIAIGGVAKVIAGDTIAIGDQIATDASGRAIPATTGQIVLGDAISAGAVGNVVSVLLRYVSSATALTNSADVTVSTAELKALNATPKQLVAAPGAGYALVLDSILLFLDYNSTAYDGIAGGEDLVVRYTDGSGTALATIEATGFLDQTSDQTRYATPTVQTTTAGQTPAANAALVLHMATGEIATGNSPLKVRVKYRTIPTTL